MKDTSRTCREDLWHTEAHPNTASVGRTHKKLAAMLLPLLLVLIPTTTTAQVAKILPLGDSITYDNEKGDTRPIADRIAYRYTLHNLLTSAGYAFDFVGSEDAGERYLSAEMDDNAGFPGITDAQLAVLISTGYSGRTSVQVTPGAYLETHPADIILLHIGTNSVDGSPDDVSDILDNIRQSDPDVYIILARIINRHPHSRVTTTFNDNVEAMVEARHDKRIIMVDMENGAGINYCTDMAPDGLHPNRFGYNKMAVVWFNALITLNSAPEISGVPSQQTDADESFTDISLDDYVTDAEDDDADLQWSWTQDEAGNLSVSIDDDRILRVEPAAATWSGTESIWITVKDTGSGALVETDSVEVSYTVNGAPLEAQ